MWKESLWYWHHCPHVLTAAQESRVDFIVIIALVPHPQQWEVPPSVKHCTHIRGRNTFLELILQHPTISFHYALLDTTTIESLNFAKYFDLCNLLPWLTQLRKEAGQTVYPFDCFALFGNGSTTSQGALIYRLTTVLGGWQGGGPADEKTRSLTGGRPLKPHIKLGPRFSESQANERAQIAKVPAEGHRSVRWYKHGPRRPWVLAEVQTPRPPQPHLPDQNL